MSRAALGVQANAFLREYLPTFNQRFRVTPANKTDVHVKSERYFNLDQYLCIKTNRTVRNDNTVAHKSKLYQIKEKVMSRQVIVEERLNGSVHVISSSGVSLKYREILERPKKVIPSKSNRGSRKPHVPAMNHPWRRSPNLKSIVRKKVYTQLTKQDISMLLRIGHFYFALTRGHKSVDMTLRYSHLSPSHKRKAVESLELIDGHYLDTRRNQARPAIALSACEITDAEVVKLVDTLRSGRSSRKGVGVRVPPSAFLIL